MIVDKEIDHILLLSQTDEQHMVNKLKISKDQNECKECKEILEDICFDWIKLCKDKSLDPKVNIVLKSVADKERYFFAINKYMKADEYDDTHLNRCDIKLSKAQTN